MSVHEGPRITQPCRGDWHVFCVTPISTLDYTEERRIVVHLTPEMYEMSSESDDPRVRLMQALSTNICTHPHCLAPLSAVTDLGDMRPTILHRASLRDNEADDRQRHHPVTSPSIGALAFDLAVEQCTKLKQENAEMRTQLDELKITTTNLHSRLDALTKALGDDSSPEGVHMHIMDLANTPHLQRNGRRWEFDSCNGWVDITPVPNKRYRTKAPPRALGQRRGETDNSVSDEN